MIDNLKGNTLPPVTKSNTDFFLAVRTFLFANKGRDVENADKIVMGEVNSYESSGSNRNISDVNDLLYLESVCVCVDKRQPEHHQIKVGL